MIGTDIQIILPELLLAVFAMAALLFGVLYQGGAELSFDKPTITRDMVVVIGGIVILFAGALDGLFRRLVAGVLSLGRGKAA